MDIRVMQRNENSQLEVLQTPPQIMTKELTELVGVSSPPAVMEVERGAIRRYALAIEDPNPLYSDVNYARRSKHLEMICPPGFFGWPVKPVSASSGLYRQVMDIGHFHTNMDVGVRFDFLSTIRAGERLFSVAKIADMYEEVSRSGKRRLVCAIETCLTNLDGELAARCSQTVYFFP